jgi:nicotinate-nucleotide pyrophosphorylase (carboxylating)
MSSSVEPPVHAVRDAVTRALVEDLTPLGDLTSALLPPEARAAAVIVSRAPGVVAGTACVVETWRQLDSEVWVQCEVDDGDAVQAGQRLATVDGPLASVLTGERTALNLLGHLSGIATATARMVEAVAGVGRGTQVWDTRKTTPGLRTLEKAAVRAGGGVNHRGNLSDWVMLKDNHLAVLPIAEAVAAARRRWPGRAVHVECDRLEQVDEALAAGADLVLLDNMAPDQVAAAVEVRDVKRPDCLVEASGGISLENARAYAEAGVDLISSGAITNSAPVLDVALDITSA